MRIRLSDADLVPDLVAFFRGRSFLVVGRDSTTLDVKPINALSERADRERVVRLLEEWAKGHPGVDAAIRD